MAGRIRKQAIVCLACFGMVVSQTGFAQTASPLTQDVRLGSRGTLRGNVVDHQGRTVANAPVAIQFNGVTVASTQTNKKGEFVITGLRGGVHTVVSAKNRKSARLWSASVAPPSADSAVVVQCVRQGVVRGQGEVIYEEGPYLDSSGAMLGGVAIAGAIIGIAAWADSNSSGPSSP